MSVTPCMEQVKMEARWHILFFENMHALVLTHQILMRLPHIITCVYWAAQHADQLLQWTPLAKCTRAISHQ